MNTICRVDTIATNGANHDIHNLNTSFKFKSNKLSTNYLISLKGMSLNQSSDLWAANHQLALKWISTLSFTIWASPLLYRHVLARAFWLTIYTYRFTQSIFILHNVIDLFVTMSPHFQCTNRTAHTGNGKKCRRHNIEVITNNTMTITL